MSLLRDAFPNYCIHENAVLLYKNKTLIYCKKCDKTLQCPHHAGTYSHDGAYFGVPPSYCKLCHATIDKDGDYNARNHYSYGS